MAEARIRVEDFEDSVLPGVCVASGREPERLDRFTAWHRPSWPMVFVLLGPVGWVVMLVVALGTQHKVTGWLPYCAASHEEAVRSRRHAELVALGSLVATVAAVLALALAHVPAIAAVTALGGAVVVGRALHRANRPAGSVGVALDRTGRHVVVRGVHPDFVMAYRAQEVERVRARRELAGRFANERA